MTTQLISLAAAKKEWKELDAQELSIKRDWYKIHWQRGFLLTQVKAALKHGEFTPWVEKELGCHAEHATKLLAVANLPSPDELKTGLQAGFAINLDLVELAKAGRAVKRGVEPQAAIQELVDAKKQPEVPAPKETAEERRVRREREAVEERARREISARHAAEINAMKDREQGSHNQRNCHDRHH